MSGVGIKIIIQRERRWVGIECRVDRKDGWVRRWSRGARDGRLSKSREQLENVSGALGTSNGTAWADVVPEVQVPSVFKSFPFSFGEERAECGISQSGTLKEGNMVNKEKPKKRQDRTS